MVFVLLNLILGVGIIIFSKYFDIDERDNRARSFVSLILQLGVIVVFVLIDLTSQHFGNQQFVKFMTRVMFFFIGMFLSTFLVFVLEFPRYEKNMFHTVLRYVLWFVALFIVAKIGPIGISQDEGIVLIKPGMIKDGFSWFDVYKIAYLGVLPAACIAVLLAKARERIQRLYKQQAVLWALGVVFAYVLFHLLNAASHTVPGYGMLFPYALGALLVVVYISAHVTIMIDLSSVLKAAAKAFVFYLLPGLILGVVFALFAPLRESSPAFFWCAMIIATIAMIVFQRVAEKKLKEKGFAKDASYEEALEKALSEFDYNTPYDELVGKFASLMKEHLETVQIEILMDGDAGKINSVYTSESRPSDPIPTALPLMDSLGGTKSSIIFKNQIETKHEFSTFKEPLAQLFDSLNAEALVLLRESRHLFGLIVFGAKRRGDDYSEYDFKTLSNLYSYFFLFGFYMKNIANQSLVGTVAREIQMSSQVIRSIQENVDPFKYPSVDVGYISRSARSLGGDFIDFIRLTNTRHMIIMGDVSGKGLNASMSMVILKSIIRTLLSETSDFKELIEKVNHFIKYNLPRGTFFAGFFALFDSSDSTMYYINCGLPVLFLYTESYNNVIEIQGDGKVLGFAKKVGGLIHVKKIKLNPGDIVMACTDGLLDSESLRGEQYGKDRVQRLILDNKTFDAWRLVQFTYDDMLQFTSKELQDDVTAVAIKMLKN